MSILISEIYGPVIQGEGMVAGVPTIFVRVGGCDYRCGFNKQTGEFDRPFVCDSLYAVLPANKHTWHKMDADDILGVIGGLAPAPMMITLSGGNPALYDFTEVIRQGQELGYTFAIETQGTIFPTWAPMLDHVTISPKPPSSGMHTDWNKLHHWLGMTPVASNMCAKVVVFNDEDFSYATDIWSICRYYNIPLFLQAGTSNPYIDTSTPEGMGAFRDAILTRTAWLGDQVIKCHMSDTRVLPQIHALINGAKRGV